MLTRPRVRDVDALLQRQRRMFPWPRGAKAPYQHFRVVTIDRTKVPNTDQTDFPMLFSGTYPYLATVANGGMVHNANGFDIVFTADLAGLVQLDHEIDSYDPATGAVNFWVRVPTVQTAVETAIYLRYRNGSISSSQENKPGVWSNNFKLVAHLRDGSSLDASDSSPNNYTPTILGGTAAAGHIGGGVSFAASGTNAIRWASGATGPTAAMTASFWCKRSAIGGTRIPMCRANGTTHPGSAFEFVFNSSNQLRFEVNSGSAWQTALYATAINDTTTWHYAVGTFDGSDVRIYTEGALRATTPYSGAINNPPEDVFIGSQRTGLNDFPGTLDEVRIANVARSADWITTEFNNQSSPSTFYSVGPQN